MVKTKNYTNTASKPRRKTPPARTIEGRENQLISKAIDIAEQQLEDGTASPLVIVHFLKLGTTRSQLEKEKLEKENALLKAKTESYHSAKHVEELYEDAMRYMKRYSGVSSSEEELDD